MLAGEAGREAVSEWVWDMLMGERKVRKKTEGVSQANAEGIEVSA